MPNLEEIGEKCFYGCHQLVYCNKLISKRIKSLAFEGCINLTIQKVYCNSIEENSIETCTNLKSKHKNIKAYNYGFCGDIFYIHYLDTKELVLKKSGWTDDYDTENNKAPWFPYKDNIVNVTVEDGVKNLGNALFYKCNQLVNVKFPKNLLISIGISCFQGCFSLPTLNLPNSINKIYSSALYGCSRIDYITLPSNLQYIDSYLMCECTFLQSITIPDSVTYILMTMLLNIADV